jgi:dTDP-4-dehydrorhamnose 3,5-epimerase
VALSIPEIIQLTPTRHVDERGYFVETYSAQSLANIGIRCNFVQDNQSFSIHRGTIRGLHFQSSPYAQAKLVRVLQGSIYDVAVDLRRGSPTYGRWCGSSISAEEGQQIFIPIGFAHAFCTLEPNTIVAYKVDAYYCKACEGGLRWDDPSLAIDWPVSAAEVSFSEKDRQLAFLRDFCSPFVF